MPTRNWPPFEEARTRVQQLGVKLAKDYRENRPEGLPSEPDLAYRDQGWAGWGDFLGAGEQRGKRGRDFDWLPFEDARRLARSLDFKSCKAYQAHHPPILPAAAEVVYADSWKSWRDFLGLKTDRYGHPVFPSYEEVQASVRELKIISSNDYSKRKPDGFPSDPRRTYKERWKGWAEFLGVGYGAAGKVNKFSRFEEARSIARSCNFSGVADYLKRRPTSLPPNPSEVYKHSGWKGFYDFLGKEKPPQWIPFTEARALARSLTFPTIESYFGGHPPNLPSDPRITYRKVWTNWNDYLGIEARTGPRVLRTRLLGLLKEILASRDLLSECDLLQLLRASGTLNTLHTFLPGKPLSEILDALRNDGFLADVAAETAATQQSGDDEVDIEPTHKDKASKVSRHSVRSIDRFAALGQETIARLIHSQFAELRCKYIDEGLTAVEEIVENGPQNGKFFRQIKRRFLAEARATETLSVPEWQLCKEGQPVEPNRMQKLTAYQMTKRRTWGNWSGAGAGKTDAAGLAAYVTDSRLTVVIAYNSTVSGWSRQLRETFAGARVVLKPEEVQAGRGMFLILNYEKFQRTDAELVDMLVALNPDMIVLDEVQLIKHRAGENSSLRRSALCAGLLRRLPTVKVLAMSATPVINDLSEGISLLEIAAGKPAPHLKTRKTINNALSVYYELIEFGLRYRPLYKQNLETKIVTARRDDLLDVVSGCHTISELERVLFAGQLEAVKDLIRPGTILYSEFVEGIIDPIVDFVRSLGLTAARYTGSEDSKTEREQIQQKFMIGEIDVLVASRAISIGVDGLQERCNRMIILSLPWTHAAYEQLIGRIYRQGSTAASVEIIVPQIIIATPTEPNWSWHTARLALVESKRTLSDCATDGVIPNLLAIEKEKVFARLIAQLKKASAAGA